MQVNPLRKNLQNLDPNSYSTYQIKNSHGGVGGGKENLSGEPGQLG